MCNSASDEDPHRLVSWASSPRPGTPGTGSCMVLERAHFGRRCLAFCARQRPAVLGTRPCYKKRGSAQAACSLLALRPPPLWKPGRRWKARPPSHTVDLTLMAFPLPLLELCQPPRCSQQPRPSPHRSRRGKYIQTRGAESEPNEQRDWNPRPGLVLRGLWGP